MRKIVNYMGILGCISLLLFVMACGAQEKNNTDIESKDKYFNLEDFDTITLDKTTVRDLDKRYLSVGMIVTSYGGYCNYPVQDGGYIRLKFYGPDLVIGSIEYIADS